MNNVIIAGSGRSGTSLAAGTLARSGYFMGEHLLLPSPSNPKGYFESYEINELNEEIIRPVVKSKPRRFRFLFKKRPGKLQLWLARVPLDQQLTATPSINARIQTLTHNVPFCFKDPRFSYTLPVWQPHLPANTAFLCVFRHPLATVTSILKECRSRPYLKNLSVTFEDIVKVWLLMYQHILALYRQEGNWLFIHFEQILTHEGLTRLEAFTGAKVDRSFPEARLNRSLPEGEVSEEVIQVYQRLCQAANYTPRQQ